MASGDQEHTCPRCNAKWQCSDWYCLHEMLCPKCMRWMKTALMPVTPKRRK